MADAGTGNSFNIGVGGGGGGGGSNWQEGLQIGGMAEQDIASFLGAYYSTKAKTAAIDTAESYLGPAYESARGYVSPYYNLNLQNVQNLSNLTNAGAFTTTPQSYQFQGQAPTAPSYTPEQFNFYQEPGYQFVKQQGQEGLQSSAAARGMGLSGATLQALDQYNTGLASREYQNAFNRYQANRELGQQLYGQNINLYGQQLGEYQSARQYGLNQATQNYLNQLNANKQNFGMYNTLAGIGSEAPGQMSNLALGEAQTRANLELARGGAQAAGYQAAANAAIGQGQHLGEIGGGMQNTTSNPQVNYGGDTAPLTYGGYSQPLTQSQVNNWQGYTG